MCKSAIKCLVNTCCETISNAITYYACQVPIYTCVGAVFNQIIGCCINLWQSHNAVHPPATATTVYPAEPILVHIIGTSDEHHEGLE